MTVNPRGVAETVAETETVAVTESTSESASESASDVGYRTGYPAAVRAVVAIVLGILAVAAACGPSDVPVSNQTLCSQLGTAICMRGDVCTEANGSSTQCASQFVKGCCQAATCGQSSGSVYLTDLERCTTDIASFDCDELGMGHLPLTCPSPGPH